MNEQPIPEGLERTPEGIYVVSHDSHLSKWVREHKRLDIAEGQIAFFKKYIPVGGTVVDAGASLGDHTLTYAKLVGPSGRVLAFEPHPLTFQALKLNFDQWSSVVCVNKALADENNSIAFARDTNIGASYCEFFNGSGEQVECTKLDEYLDAFMSCDLIHFDVEGAECAAIRGARETITKFRPAIVLEINHQCLSRMGLSECDVNATLKELGYSVSEIEKEHGSHLPQRDVIALPIQ